MIDSLLVVLITMALVSAVGSSLLARRRFRKKLGFKWLAIWGMMPVIGMVVLTIGCEVFVSDESAANGACMALGGLMIALPLFYWPAWLIGTVLGLLAERVSR